ncbi:hypothetical protein ACFWBF_03950 [Streptomyces sp. NPDC060028]|uniref:hypothetical protein n=1 Tax=Streptomyces sp. NPDC060028 TaxID=3347041 RepID=UPI00369EF144
MTLPGRADGGHSRSGTAQAAFAGGASYVVVGRAVARAADPAAALARVGVAGQGVTGEGVAG